MIIQHATAQKTTACAPWASPTLTYFGSLGALTASGSGLLNELVLCERDGNGDPIPGTCNPYPDATRARG